MSIAVVRVLRSAKRFRIVSTLKRIQRPFAIWPIIAAFIKPVKALSRYVRTGDVKTEKLRRPIPAYALLLVLLVGIAGGAYLSSAITGGTLGPSSNGPDFTIALLPASATLNPGSTASFSVKLTSTYNFAGSVNLNATPPRSNMIVAANPSSVSLLTGTANAILSVLVPTSTPTGTFVLNLTGSSGKLSHSVQAFLLVTSPPPPEFTVTANSTSITVSQGSSATSSLTISSISGFSGMINLTSTVSPVIANGPSSSLNPTRVTLTSGGTANALLSVSTSGLTPQRGYTILVLATSGTFSHSISISLTVQ